VFEAAPFKRPLRFYRPDGMNRHDGWLAVESCGYSDFAEAQTTGARFQEALLIVAAKQKLGVEFYLRGPVEAIHVYPGGKLELRELVAELLFFAGRRDEGLAEYRGHCRSGHRCAHR
jgi:hypothetical protein